MTIGIQKEHSLAMSKLPDQESTSNATPGTYCLEYRPNGINLWVQQNNAVPTGWSSHDGNPVMGWTSASSSRENTQTSVRLLHSSCSGAGTDQRLDKMQSEPQVVPLQQCVNLNEGNGQARNSLSFLQGGSSTSNTVPHNFDLDSASESKQDMGAGLCLNSFNEGRHADQNASASDYSDSTPVVISSGIAGYVLGESKRSCKRRAPEYASGQLSLGESSRSAMEARSCQQHALNSLENAGPLHVRSEPSSAAPSGLGASAGASSGMHQSSSMVGQLEHPERNIRLRRYENQHDFGPASLSTFARSSPHIQTPVQPPVLLFDHLSSTSSAAGMVDSTPAMWPHVHIPNLSQTGQPLLQNGATRARTGMPAAPSYTMNGGCTWHQGESSWNNQRFGMPRPEFQRGNVGHMPRNLNSPHRANFPGYSASGSRNGPIARGHLPSSSTWFPQGNITQQYEQRMSGTVNCSMSWVQGNYRPIQLGASAAARERITVRGGNPRPFQMPRPGLIVMAERETGGHPEMPLPALTAAQQRRSRLVSEVRNALALVCRRGSLWLEDVMVLDRSVLYDVPEEEEPDLHEDMRLDVDDMSYEDLLALEEQIGNVCTGLSDDAILENVKQQKYRLTAAGSSTEEEPCCICQEEYANGEGVGKLNCGHDFHFNCIKQWLRLKNNCPICKDEALKD